VAAVYLALVCALAASAFANPNQAFSWGREGVALGLTLPAVVPALPFVYLTGAGIWDVTGADSGGPMWPVTLVYTLMFATVAVVNLWLLRRVLGRRSAG